MEIAQRTKAPGQYNRSFNQFLSSQPACEFTLSVRHDDEYQPDDFDNPSPYKVSYGFSTVKFWIPSKQQWESPDPTKFTVHGEDFATCKSEFWARYHKYCITRFGDKIYTYSSYRAEQAYNGVPSQRFNAKSSTTNYQS